MSLLDDDELALLREDVESVMPDECSITRPGERGAFNESTGQYAASAGSTIYEGVCRVKQMSEQDRLVIFGEREVGLVAYIATLPHDAPELQKDDLFTLSVHNDAQLLTKTLEVHSVKFGGVNAHRKVVLEEKR